MVLAAGGATRFGRREHKLLASFRGRPLVSWAVDHAVAAGLDETLVVTGAVDLITALPPGVTVIENARWADGQATSLQAAVSWARDGGFEALVVGLGDQPLVPPEAWRAVSASASPIAVATFDGQRRPPTRLAASVWPLLPVDGDEGARVVMAGKPELVEVVACRGKAIDIDTPEDLARWS
ncbi:MAG: nucleotidyltransferase family protein [Acidimicrobiales bacterium]